MIHLPTSASQPTPRSHTAQYSPNTDTTITGRITHIIYRNETNTFQVATVLPDGSKTPMTAILRGNTAWPGQLITMAGTWQNRPPHGRQFDTSTFSTQSPATRDGLIAYLTGGAFPGIGTAKARRLLEAFGTDLPAVLAETPERIAAIDGISAKNAADLAAAWAASSATTHADQLFFRSLGITTAQIRALRQTYGSSAASKVHQNPYLLAHNVRGIGFQRADTIARSLGIGPDTPARIEAGLREALHLARTVKGHTYLPEAELVAEATQLLRIGSDLVASTLATTRSSTLKPIALETGIGYAAPWLATQEETLAELVRKLAAATPPWRISNPDAALKAAEHATQKTLTASQCRAFHGLLRHRIAALIGAPGTGKTATLQALLHAIKATGITVRLAAPTGLAALNMQRATGLPAETIHNALGFDPETGDFLHTRSRPLECDLLVLDEASMIDVSLQHAVLTALHSKAAVILVGDPEQLEPVGPGRPFRDILESGRIPIFELTEIRRQAAGSAIIEASQQIRQGQTPTLTDQLGSADFVFIQCTDPQEIHTRVIQLAGFEIPRLLGIDPLRDIQVLSPMNPRERPLSTEALQPDLKNAINPFRATEITLNGTSFSLGDRVINTRNNYQLGVKNGEIGIITNLDQKTPAIVVNFLGRHITYEADTLRDLKLGYAISVHKSQGSEFPAVIMPIVAGHQFLLRRRLLLTAVSRAKQLMVMVGDPRALIKAIHNTRDEVRFTRLKSLLSRP